MVAVKTSYAEFPELLRSRLASALLPRRAGDRAIGTEDAAISGLGAQQLAATSAFVEELAGIGRHPLNFFRAAFRTGKHRVQDHGKSPPKISEHVADIRRARRIRKYRLLDPISGQIIADRQGEDVDDLVGVRADDMCAENASGLIFHKGLVAVDGFGDATRRTPGSGLFALGAEFETRCTGVRLAQSD
jgi:hypothetical protein